MLDTESFIAGTNTNYSRLTYKPTGPNIDDDNDDAKSWRTHDMLSEDEELNVELDPLEIVELRQTIDEQFNSESRFGSKQPTVSQEQPTSSQQHNQLPEIIQQSQVDTQPSMVNQSQLPFKNEIKPLIKIDTQNTDDNIPDRQIDNTPSPNNDAMDLHEIEEEINDLSNTEKDIRNENMMDDNINDWGDDYGQDWSDQEIDLATEGYVINKKNLSIYKTSVFNIIA